MSDVESRIAALEAEIQTLRSGKPPTPVDYRQPFTGTETVGELMARKRAAEAAGDTPWSIHLGAQSARAQARAQEAAAMAQAAIAMRQVASTENTADLEDSIEHDSAEPTALEEQIAAAQAAGDWQRSMALKAERQQMARRGGTA